MSRKNPGQSEDAAPKLSGFGVNAGLVSEIQQRYEVDPDSVHESWADLFEPGHEKSEAPAASRPEPAATAETVEPPAPIASPKVAEKYARVLRLIHAFRARGHRIARTDPLGAEPEYFPELDPAHYKLGNDDLDSPFFAGDLPGGPIQTLRQILDRLRSTYCGRIGVEFTHIQDPGPRQWLMHRMENSENTTELSPTEKLRVLERVCAAELFEHFLHKKFIGQKRFGLEGAETLIPMLDTIVEDSPGHGVRELVIGMAHRGRLNVLSNIMGKSLESMFGEFEDVEDHDNPFGSGDVKYHKGFSSDRRTVSGERVHLSLTANPSHLEAVDPVVEGRRAPSRSAPETCGGARSCRS